jgi:hypothetical protein
MTLETLSTLLYSNDTRGPWQLYIFDHLGYHSGGQWFDRVLRYPDEEITIAEAKQRCDSAIAEKCEVRVCDGGDMLVFHSENGVTKYGENFWTMIEANYMPIER